MGKVRGRRTNKKDIIEDSENSASIDAELSKRSEESTNESIPFFGLVDSNELTYFHQAEQTLNLNTFNSPEEKNMFIDSVFQEARGKELKLVTNQICSKLMERLILNSTLKNIHQLFNAFNGRFYDLSRQKYSSHVIETFLVRAASFIEKEILSSGNTGYDEMEEDEESEGWVSMENMFLFIMGDFKTHLKSMMKDKYASHVLRLALLVMTGKELPSSVESNSILRSKKSKIARKMIEIKDSEDYQKKFQVPASFKEELREVLKEITNDESSESLRELSISSISSPFVQLLIQLEGIVDRDRTIWKTIFNGDNPNADAKDREMEGSFVEYLLSDNIGSHFLQNAIENQKVKSIERIYESYMKDRIVKLAKRETTGVYVVETMMEKLKSKQQLEILDNLIPVLNELIVNNLDIGSKIVECAIKNGNYKKEEIIDKFTEFFNKGNEQSGIFENILKINTSTLFSTKDDWPTSEERRRALFLEKLIEFDQDKILKLCIEDFLNFDNETLLKFCKHGVFSHIVESILDKRETLNLIQRKTILNKFLSGGSKTIVDLACNSTGSHIIDKFWMFTFKLNMYKERIARALFDDKDTVKNTVYGRMVWKNWNMEMYCRKFNDWKWDVKEEEKKYDEEKKKQEMEAALNNDNAIQKDKENSNKRKNDDNANNGEDGMNKRSYGRGRGRGRKN
ncbi:Nucleolar protein 9 [Pichia californica]|uniref:Nucleolar protein 9 n=1 Tax=Pichia californica TaxID=460514 RepID=A0A9P7BHJ5_9ASCO|nr:Nucleolar protein 9 [[Candida] californica]KAG0691396.1 Nucleolar protein 9 [[Candida] californica]